MIRSAVRNRACLRRGRARASTRGPPPQTLDPWTAVGRAWDDALVGHRPATLIDTKATDVIGAGGPYGRSWMCRWNPQTAMRLLRRQHPPGHAGLIARPSRALSGCVWANGAWAGTRPANDAHPIGLEQT